MISQPERIVSLRDHVLNLKYALTTTSCRVTVKALQEMLEEAEVRLQEQGAARNPSESKPL
ncbi:hypothetical protein BV98_003423 [Sphingobium herbicidovorans NBRC 16415]|uniref:Uncharacterized protein n=1 Tax=Sphingobium herbicidovorans (strain ATCC 700291 / DSM 11019 / CCUG 56400 / KCTC 2939 / LMG 18315 / NBRC 16415 / MH) TaxID=1219045 RepID=A0A086P5Y0_SPHHM|nr:hypothetical protein BV98_003423 [Sphingobium herbicidovorans NBRC 16415]